MRFLYEQETAGGIYLRDILRELEDIATFTADGKIVFLTDTKTRKAVIRSYEVIGEIAKRLPDDVRAASSQIDWRKLISAVHCPVLLFASPIIPPLTDS